MKIFLRLTICASILLLAFSVAFSYDMQSLAKGQSNTLKLRITDTNNQPVHNAKITIKETGKFFFTDENGISPNMQIDFLKNVYDENVNSWFCVTLLIEKQGFVNTVVFNCVVFCNTKRDFNVKIYQQDESDLPFVCYVESPPKNFINDLFSNKT